VNSREKLQDSQGFLKRERIGFLVKTWWETFSILPHWRVTTYTSIFETLKFMPN
jgi:hypothetical protein